MCYQRCQKTLPCTHLLTYSVTTPFLSFRGGYPSGLNWPDSGMPCATCAQWLTSLYRHKYRTAVFEVQSLHARRTSICMSTRRFTTNLRFVRSNVRTLSESCSPKWLRSSINTIVHAGISCFQPHSLTLLAVFTVIKSPRQSYAHL